MQKTNHILKKWEIALALGLVITILLSLCSFGLECNRIRSDVLRLHILANSDSSADQSLKLKVRDKILEKTADLFAKSESIDDAIARANANVEQIKSTALAEIKNEGYNYDVNVEVAPSDFSTRSYTTDVGSVTLPAGKYLAVRVLIGKAQGHNWWCVMYPGMCLPAADNDEINKALDSDEQDIVKNYTKYEIKFKSVEIFEDIKNFFSSNT